MKKLIIFLLFIFPIVCFADTTIYCPKCKVALYNYVGDFKSNVKAHDFKPIGGIPQPIESTLVNCPFDNAPLNGWEYWAWALHRHNDIVYNAVSLLTKDEQGNWKWVPYDINLPEMEELMKNGNT